MRTNKISLQSFITGAELVNALINQFSWFIQTMPDIATLRANVRRITELADAVEKVRNPQDFYAHTGPYEFEYFEQNPELGLTVEQLELFHTGADLPFLRAPELHFGWGDWVFVSGDFRQRQNITASRHQRALGARTRPILVCRSIREHFMPRRTSSFSPSPSKTSSACRTTATNTRMIALQPSFWRQVLAHSSANWPPKAATGRVGINFCQAGKNRGLHSPVFFY